MTTQVFNETENIKTRTTNCDANSELTKLPLKDIKKRLREHLHCIGSVITDLENLRTLMADNYDWIEQKQRRKNVTTQSDRVNWGDFLWALSKTTETLSFNRKRLPKTRRGIVEDLKNFASD